MIRAVLNTNVLLSALRSRNGAPFEILSRFAANQFVADVGNTVLSEYDEVLKQECPAFGISLATVDR